ncbi:MAG: MFS transporter [Rhodospirillales bacterium]|nr:MFS transporter [Rhodospirillales bacterium]MBT4040003.1 MFS transporter [Rhodospirillales bacterium]MBT4625827.1 MFS transporter [Rhodospirillales bacterium]MBT5351665.1 MFS transporter [Rhodospirillales bacterium]MBT5521342.1 MFS transporter [Rhodospirillales bacterium]
MPILYNIPILIGALGRPTMPAFSILFLLEPMTRSIIVTAVPLMALEKFGTAQNVSVFFFVLGISGVTMSLVVPWLVSKMRRRGTFLMGIITGLIGMALFTHGEIWSLCAGMAIHLFAASCIDVTLNLYMMEHIRRRDFGRFEPVRMFFLAFSWCVGPFLGVYLRNAVAPEAPFIAGGMVILILAAYFLYLRFVDHPTLATSRIPVTNPIRYLPRFFAQPRMRLVYVLSLVRSGWWTMIFIYVPIYCVTAGLGETMGGALVSLTTLFVMSAPLWRGLVQRIGIRHILYIGYFGTGIVTIVASALMDEPYITIGTILIAGLFAVATDAVGNTLFYRAVHPYERSEMATVFASYRPVSSLAFPGIYSGVLAIFPLAGVFAVTGVCMMAAGAIASYIPKRMN